MGLTQAAYKFQGYSDSSDSGGSFLKFSGLETCPEPYSVKNSREELFPCNFDADCTRCTFESDLDSGKYKILETGCGFSTKKSKKDSVEEISWSGSNRCSNRFRERGICGEASTRSGVRNAASWSPSLVGFSPSEISNRGLERISLLGFDLIPEGVDVVNGDFVEVYFVDGAGVEHVCDVVDYWSNEENVYCLTPTLSEGTYTVKMKVLDNNGQMTDIGNINPASGYSCSGGCSVTVVDDSSSSPKTQLYSHRLFNGISSETDLFWTNWTNLNALVEGADELEGYQQWAAERLDCDFPIDIEIRSVANQTLLENIPEVVYEFANSLKFFEAKVANQLQNYTLEDMEFRVYCDSETMHMSGSWKNQEMPSSSDPLSGINIPKFKSLDGRLVGTCNFKFDNVDYPQNVGNEDGSWDAEMRCHVDTSSDYHGPATVEVTGEQEAVWLNKADAQWGKLQKKNEFDTQRAFDCFWAVFACFSVFSRCFEAFSFF